MPGEFDLINWIKQQQSKSDLVNLPAGDDLAILNWPTTDLLLIGVDQVLDGVHFDSKIHDPQSIGRKAMNRNLSDCAAMACLPAAAVVTFALPKGKGLDYAQKLYEGIRQAGDKFNCPIIGGDTASWLAPLAITVTILGKSAGITPVERSGAQPGDHIYVTGPLGGSIRGRHIAFEPRIEWGRELAKAGATAMADLSDGLARDLRNICQESGVGAVIEEQRIPLHSDALDAGVEDGLEPVDQYLRTIGHALHDGEDYELLVVGPGLQHPSLILIGKIVAEPGLWVSVHGLRQPLTPKGWEHAL